MFNFILLAFFESSDNKILDISISKEFINALLIYLSLEKFKSIAPLTLTLSTMKTFSSERLFENNVSENIAVVKIMKIYFLNFAIKYFGIK